MRSRDGWPRRAGRRRERPSRWGGARSPHRAQRGTEAGPGRLRLQPAPGAGAGRGHAGCRPGGARGDRCDRHHRPVRVAVPDADGGTVVDRFVASRPDLSAADREMVLGWRDPVEGIFEIRSKDGDAVILLNLLDDLEYRTYSNVGPTVFRPLPRGGFVHARLVPIRPVPGAWLISGTMSAYRKSGAAQIAQAAMELATSRPELVFRNPEKIEQGWEQMQQG